MSLKRQKVRVTTNPTIVFTAPARVQIKEMDQPVPGCNEVLVKTHCTLISIGTELTVLSGDYPADSRWVQYGQYPFYPGYNNIGHIVAIGPEADNSWLGKTVATCGRHAAYVLSNINKLRTVRSDVADEEAAFFAIAEIVMNSIRRCRLEWGEAVAVYGLGLLGQLAVRLCQTCGARPIFAIDVSEERLRRLPSRESVIPIHASREDAVGIVKKHTRDRMVDVVFEVTGVADLIPKEFSVLRRQGRFVVLSSPRGKTSFDFHDLCNAPSYTIIGAHNASHPEFASLDYPWTNHRHAELFFDLIADGEIDMRSLISHRARYRDAVRIYKMLLKDRTLAMGVVLDWNKRPP